MKTELLPFSNYSVKNLAKDNLDKKFFTVTASSSFNSHLAIPKDELNFSKNQTHSKMSKYLLHQKKNNVSLVKEQFFDEE